MGFIIDTFCFPWRHLQPQKTKKTRVWFFLAYLPTEGPIIMPRCLGSEVQFYNAFDWRNPAPVDMVNICKYHKYQIIHRVLHIPGGAGFLPSALKQPQSQWLPDSTKFCMARVWLHPRPREVHTNFNVISIPHLSVLPKSMGEAEETSGNVESLGILGAPKKPLKTTPQKNLTWHFWQIGLDGTTKDHRLISKTKAQAEVH